MIKNIKNIQIVCRNQNQVKNCLNYLKQLGFDVEDFTSYYDCCNIIFWGDSSKKFIISNMLKINLPIEFYNKELVKTLQKFIKEKEEKEKAEDIEVASDGRIIKINNWESDKYLYFIARWDYIILGFTNIERQYIEYYVNLGLAFISKEARDKAKFKMEIETKLKNVAERLNAGKKIDWKNYSQSKYGISYDYKCKELIYCINGNLRFQATIYCLDRNFLEVAKQEIGEQDLIKYFKEDLN